MYIVIAGCGRIGSYIAKELSNEGHDLSIIDKNKEKLDVLGSGFNGQRIKGVEFDTDVLIDAGIEKADIFLALTSDDNINITASQIAKKIYNIPRVIARICDPNREFIYRKLQIETINPTQLGGYILKHKITGKGIEIINSLSDEIDIIQIQVLKEKYKTIKEIEEKYNCIISGILRDEELIIAGKVKDIQIGDKIICTINKKDEMKLSSAISREMII